MFKFEYLKETIAVFISNAISDHEMSFEIKHTTSTISGSNWENVKHIEFQPNLPVCLWKKGVAVNKWIYQSKLRLFCD